jgi:hypothetical protein
VDTRGVETQSAIHARPAFKLLQPNVWVLDLRFNVGTYTVAASNLLRPDPAASSRRSAYTSAALCVLDAIGSPPTNC